MANTVWNSNCKCSIQQTSHKTNSVWPSARVVVVLSPYLSAACMLFRHHCENHHSRNETTHWQSKGNAVEEGNEPISEAYNSTTRPIDNLEYNEYLPCMPLHSRIFQQIHSNALIPQHGAHRWRWQQPRASIQIPSEEPRCATSTPA